MLSDDICSEWSTCWQFCRCANITDWHDQNPFPSGRCPSVRRDDHLLPQWILFILTIYPCSQQFMCLGVLSKWHVTLSQLRVFLLFSEVCCNWASLSSEIKIISGFSRMQTFFQTISVDQNVSVWHNQILYGLFSISLSWIRDMQYQIGWYKTIIMTSRQFLIIVVFRHQPFGFDLSGLTARMMWIAPGCAITIASCELRR